MRIGPSADALLVGASAREADVEGAGAGADGALQPKSARPTMSVRFILFPVAGSVPLPREKRHSEASMSRGMVGT
jgi:hypothetical protein